MLVSLCQVIMDDLLEVIDVQGCSPCLKAAKLVLLLCV